MGCSCISKPLNFNKDSNDQISKNFPTFDYHPKANITFSKDSSNTLPSIQSTCSKTILSLTLSTNNKKQNFLAKSHERISYKNSFVPAYNEHLTFYINDRHLPETDLQVPYVIYYSIKELEQTIRSQRSFRKRIEWVRKGMKYSYLSIEGLYRKAGTRALYTQLLNKLLGDEYKSSNLNTQEEIQKHKDQPTNITSMIKIFFCQYLSEPLLTHQMLPLFILVIDPDIVNPTSAKKPPKSNNMRLGWYVKLHLTINIRFWEIMSLRIKLKQLNKSLTLHSFSISTEVGCPLLLGVATR